MKLIPLGVCGAYPISGGGTSSYFIKDKSTNILLDFGSGAMSRIQKYIRIEDIDAIVITHYHADHVCDIPLLEYYLGINSCKKIKLFIPKSECYYYQVLYDSERFDIAFIEESTKYIVNETSLEFFLVKHLDFTYSVKVNGILGYTSDTVLCENLEKVFKGTKAVICDCSKVDSGKMHIGANDSIALCKSYNTTCLISHVVGDDVIPFTKLDGVLLVEGVEYEFI